MSRLANILFLGFLLILSLAEAQVQNDRKPNFIIILADDLGYADLSLNGSNQIKTPNIDALAETGVKFTQGYVSSAVCAPSRAGLLTGINQVEFGFDNNLAKNQSGFDPEYAGLPTTTKTIAQHLKSLGYATGIVGKWHLGEREQFQPLNRGFDEFWGYLGGGHDYLRWEKGGDNGLAPIICNYKKPQELTYITDDKGDECIDFIKRHKNEPFFLYAAFNAPHSPMQATEADLKLYEHIADLNRRTYAAMVHRLDVNVGRIMNVLLEQDLSENTFVVFLSDNGGPCDQNGSINAPLNGQKGILLEGGIRVPFIMNWRGKLPVGLTYDKAVTSLDLAPTFVSLAGGNANGFTGIDLMPYLNGNRTNAPHESLKWKFTISSAIQEGEWKLVRVPDRLPKLYHLPTDISEQNDRALENHEITVRLLKELGEWEVQLPHPLFLEGPEWRKKQLELYDQTYQLIQPE